MKGKNTVNTEFDICYQRKLKIYTDNFVADKGVK